MGCAVPFDPAGATDNRIVAGLRGARVIFQKGVITLHRSWLEPAVRLIA